MAEIYVSAELRDKILDSITGRARNTQIGAGAAYLALSSTAPSYNASGEITGITEPTAAGYARHRLGISYEPSTLEMSAASAITLEAGKVVIIHKGDLTVSMNLVSA